MPNVDIALFLPALEGGGAERVMLNLAGGFARRGVTTHLILSRKTGAYVSEIPDGVRLVDLEASRVRASVPGLVRYLRRERPAALLSTLNAANVIAVLAKRLAGGPTRAVVRQAVNVSHDLNGAGHRTPFVRSMIRVAYGRADAIIAVSRGVANDLVSATHLPAARIHVIPNPVIGPELRALAEARLDHPWFASGGAPVILGAGRLTKQKDFSTLVRAFGEVRRRRPARLIILGEGEERAELEKLARDLGVDGDVQLAGFAPNPFAYMARSAVFVLSSRWEGLPGVLIQALACGSPVVSTDCESGPREILQDGRFGPLVPLADPHALADAIERVLDTPGQAMPREALRTFEYEHAVQAYLRVLGIDAP